jgi:hypothetical protein
MSGFNSQSEGDLERIFFTEYELVDRYLGSQLWATGQNTQGQLGVGNVVGRSSPVTISGGGTNWSFVNDGINNALGIKTDGTLWAWGNIAGTGAGVTGRSSPVTPQGGGLWVNAASGSSCGAGIKTDGTLWAWGNNPTGEVGDGTTTQRLSPVTVAGGGSNWKQVSLLERNVAAIKTDGTLWTWGNNNTGQLGSGNTVYRSSPNTVAGGGTTWKQVNSGQLHMAAVKTDGTLWTWGRNFLGSLGDGTTTYRSSPITVAGGGTTWKSASAGYFNSAGIKTDGTLWVWGANPVVGAASRSSPVTTAGGGTNWKQVDVCGYAIAAAVKTDGSLWVWGQGNQGQLGLGDTVSRSSPVTILGAFNDWVQAACGYRTIHAIRRP